MELGSSVTSSETHVGGNTEARFNSPAGEPFTRAEAADLWRDSVTDYELKTLAAYVQDTFTRDRMTVKAGLRWDRQWNRALESSVPAHPFAPQWLPAVTFESAETRATNSFSPTPASAASCSS